MELRAPGLTRPCLVGRRATARSMHHASPGRLGNVVTDARDQQLQWCEYQGCDTARRPRTTLVPLCGNPRRERRCHSMKPSSDGPLALLPLSLTRLVSCRINANDVLLFLARPHKLLYMTPNHRRYDLLPPRPDLEPAHCKIAGYSSLSLNC